MHNATAFLKDVRTSDPKIIIEDVPVEELKKVICMKLKDNIEGKTVYLKPKSKWHRILLHDPWLFRRYEFISNFVCPRNTEKRSWKKVLLFCSEANKINWQQKAFGNNVDCIEADSNSLLLESQKKLKTMMCQSEVEILTYEKL